MNIAIYAHLLECANSVEEARQHIANARAEARKCDGSALIAMELDIEALCLLHSSRSLATLMVSAPTPIPDL